MNTCATLTPTLSLSEGEGVLSIPSPPERGAFTWMRDTVPSKELKDVFRRWP